MVYLFTGLSHGEQPQKSSLCEIQTVRSSTERTSADVCLEISLGSYMQQTLNIMSGCTVGIAIPNVWTVRMQILLCSNRLSVPTSTYKMQHTSMWSISSNIEQLVQQQSQLRIQWSMLRKGTFHHDRQANTANRYSVQHDDVITQIKAQAACKRTGAEPLEHWAACDPKRSLRQGNYEKLTSQTTK